MKCTDISVKISRAQNWRDKCVEDVNVNVAIKQAAQCTGQLCHV